MRIKLVDDIGITHEEIRYILENGDVYRPIRWLESDSDVDITLCYKINNDGTDGELVIIKFYSNDVTWDDVEAEIFLQLVK